jgi:N-methylhydantoinase B
MPEDAGVAAVARHAAGKGAFGPADGADPVTTEVIRSGLNAAAGQMKQTLIRTAFSPIIYETLDFAVALYDRHARLLAQAPSLPGFTGLLSYCVEGAVQAVGGPDELEPGDVVLYNVPYGTGTHQPDAAVVAPAFAGDRLVGYGCVLGHWLDIGAKDPYCTDTVDVFQEGVLFPGVKLYSAGELVADVHRIVLANSRVPDAVAGDLDAELAAVRSGVARLAELVERYGTDEFARCAERMFDHGEATVRRTLESIPDGRYVAVGRLDSDGRRDEPIEFEIAVIVAGSEVTVDYSASPPVREGPVNCPLPGIMSASRNAIMLAAGGGEAPNEGFFRPITVLTRPGSMLHALPPAPCFLGWPVIQAVEVVFEALAQASPELVPAWSGGDICALVWWGTRSADGTTWVDGSCHPVGQGAVDGGDGATLMQVAQSATRLPPVEVCEARNPWLIESAELAPDSGGEGRWRGGLGIDFRFRMLEDAWVTSTVERTLSPPAGAAGGWSGRPNGVTVIRSDGRREEIRKASRLAVRAGEVLELRTGGGGGYGPPHERPKQEIADDLLDGYITTWVG